MIQPNIILIVIDCLRKDYAYHLEKELEKYGFVTYHNTWATAPWTIPSVVSLLTGLYPSAHGVHETTNMKIPAIRIPMHLKDLMLHKVVSQLGYRTVLLSSNPFISSEFGITGFHLEENTLIIKQRLNIRKFLLSLHKRVAEKSLRLGAKRRAHNANTTRENDEKVRRLLREMLLKMFLNKLDKGCTYLLKRALNVLKHCSRQAFIYIHLMELHEPYPTIDSRELFTWHYVNMIAGKVSRRVAEKIRDGYRQEVEYVTNKLIRFVKELNKCGLLDPSLIIVTSDHGQLLGEDNLIMHGIYLREELLRVPLMIHYPESIRVRTLSSQKLVSLTKIKDLVLQIASGKEQVCDEILTCDIIFAESWGIPHDLEYFRRVHSISDRIKFLAYRFSKVKELEKHRIFVISEDFRAVVNASDNVVEEYSHLGRASYSQNRILDMVRAFLKQSFKANVRLRVSKIRKAKVQQFRH